MEFNVGDFVWVILTKDRFSNAYKLKLPNHVRTSDVLNVKYLVPFHGSNSDDDPNSRANFCQLREDDAVSLANTYMDHWDHVRV
ncbi:unnamed protein product [Prunus armeniaca]